MGRGMSLDAASPSRPRFPLIDALRGIAILAMVVFHLGWDLYFLGFWNLDVSTDPWWTAFQKAIVSSFLALAGVSLWLGHGAGIRWRMWVPVGAVAAARRARAAACRAAAACASR